MKRFLIPLIIASSLLLGGCAAGDWLRAPITTADLAAAQDAHAQAVSALEKARAIAVRLDSEQAEAIISQAERAVAVSAAAVERIKDDGSPRWLAGLSALLGVVAAVATGRAASVAGTLSRVVGGVQAVRRTLDQEQLKLADDILSHDQLKVDEDRIKAIKVAQKLPSARL